jgi:hypothetical protein
MRFKFFLLFYFYIGGAHAQIVGWPSSSKLGFNTSMSGSQLNVVTSQDYPPANNSTFPIFGLRAGTHFTQTIEMDAGFDIGKKDDMSLFHFDQHFLYQPGGSGNPMKLGVGALLLLVQAGDYTYSFNRVAGPQISAVFSDKDFFMSYSGGPIMNSTTARFSNLCHIVDLAIRLNKNQKRPLLVNFELMSLNFYAADSGYTTYATNVGMGLILGFF